VLKGQDDGSWVVSLRSRGATDLSLVASSLGGGGHRAAAGYSSALDLDATVAQLRAALTR
jgi:phosphoesterase RecJ-like protein